MKSLAGQIFNLKPGVIRTLVGVSRLDMAAAIADEAGDHAGVQVAFLDLAHRDIGAVFDEVVAALRDMALQEARVLPDDVPAALRAWWQRAVRGAAPRPPRNAALEQLVALFARVIARDVLVLAVDLPVGAPDRAAVLIQAMTRLAAAGVAAVFLAPELPRETPPFDWLAHGAMTFEPLSQGLPAPRVVRASGLSLTLLTHGAPASGSAVERRRFWPTGGAIMSLPPPGFWCCGYRMTTCWRTRNWPLKKSAP